MELLYISNSGNTKDIAQRIAHHVPEATVLGDIRDVDIEFTSDVILLGSYTYGNGKIPKALKEWVIDNIEAFKDKRIYLFGSGNTNYEHFCGALDSLEIIFEHYEIPVLSKLKVEASGQAYEEEIEQFIRSIK